MATGNDPAGLELSEEEAFAMLAMCLTSPHGLDANAEQALRKLADYCITKSNHSNNRLIDISAYRASASA